MLQDFEIEYLGPKGYEKTAFTDRPELLVVVPAQMDVPRFPDQLELGEDLLHFLRREGPLRFLPATLHPADLVRGHGCGDASGDICTRGPDRVWRVTQETCDPRYFSL